MSRKRKRVFLSGVISLATAVTIPVLICFWPSGSLSVPGEGEFVVGSTPFESPVVAKPAAGVASSLQTARNLGAALYEQGKYPEAAEQFKKVVASGHALATDHMDLALALMQNSKLDQALGELTTAHQMAPKRVAIEYALGILYKRELRYPDAEVALKRVTAADPGEPSAWFNLGTVYFSQRKFPEALDSYEHVNRMGFGRAQNFYVASLFRTFTVLLRLGRQADAQKILKLHEKFKDRVPSISLQTQALEGGKYGVILLPPVAPAIVSPPTEKVVFTDVTSKLGISTATASPPSRESARTIKASDYSLDFARKSLVTQFGPSLTLGDYDGDGHTDVYIVNPSGSNRLFHNNGNGTFTDVTEKAGVAGPAGSVSAVFADYNNSSYPSLFVAGLGGVTLYTNKHDGTFVNETEKAGLRSKAGELDTGAVLFDADADGFLDLVVTAYTNLGSAPAKATFSFPSDFGGAHSRFYRNNGNGTFSDVTESSGLGAARGRMRGAAFGSLTDSGYADLVFFRDDAPPLLFINRGEDKFENRTRFAGLSFSREIVSKVQVADFNHDGKFDLLLWGSSGPVLLRNRGGARFSAPERLPVSTTAAPFAFKGTVTDLDGDGFADVLAKDSAGKWHFLSNRAGRFMEAPLDLPQGFQSEAGGWAEIAPAWLSSPATLDLLALTHSGKFAAFQKQGPPSHWVQVKLKGFKSNMEGVGTIVELKAGNFYKKILMKGNVASVYTGDLPKLDVVRVTWPNQVIQNSVDVKTDTTVGISESERLASSCPLLYAWNGRRFVFVTDVLGVGPIGELAPDGTYIKPNPHEFVRLPRILQPRGGAYVLQVTDELREVDFVDRLRLMAVDHSPGEHIYANEIYASSLVEPELFALRNERSPVSAADDHGRDVLNLIRTADGRYPTDFKQNRILGMADTHSLTLDLGDFPNSAHVGLWLKGWVFWTDSNGSRALMGNPELPMIAPYIQVRNRQGQWVTAVADMGLPSGTNRTMRVDLTGKFPSSDHHVRIVTNLCIYWDRVFFTTDESKVQPTQVLAPLSADLHYRGFSEPTSDPSHQRPDHFEYTSLLKQAPWNPMTGDYTRYGDVLPLLSEADDRLVVLATGDEMTVEFRAGELAPLKSGLTRDFFLDAAGYAKDGEPNTAYSTTVGPMPFRAMKNYPPTPKDRTPSSAEYRQYLSTYQTRPGHKLIPPLAPVVQ